MFFFWENSFFSCLPDDDALVLAVNGHVTIHVVGQSVDVGRVLVLGLNN